MRILVGLHHLELGGSQLNAVDLATRVRDRGHHVEVFAAHQGTVGPVADLVRERNMRLTLGEHPREHPWRGAPCRTSVARALTAQASRARADIVHAYEYSMILDAFYGPYLGLGTRLVGTVYGMTVPTWLPRPASLIAGTRDLVADAQRVGQRATLIVPPVDTSADHPASVHGRPFRHGLDIRDDEIVAVIVSRLEPDMKEEGVARAMTAIRELDHAGLRLVVVGTGPSHARLATLATSLNAELGREAILMTGGLADPRPAYSAADLALGMGGSALRAMAFATPLIVLGTRGFARPFNERTADYFFRAGFYGVGSGEPDPLASQIRELLDASVRSRLGAWSRQVVLDQFSLDAAADTLESVYLRALTDAPDRRIRAAVRTAVHRGAAELAGQSLRDRLSPVARRALAGSLSPSTPR